MTIPLFLLGAAFTAVQLTNQIAILNDINRLESKFTFEGIYQSLRSDFKETTLDLEALRRKLDSLSQRFKIPAIHVFNALQAEALFPDEKLEWSQVDFKGIEGALHQLQISKSYYVTIDKASNELIAYMAFKGDGQHVYVARAHFPLADLKSALYTSRGILAIIFFFIALAGVIIGQGLGKAILQPVKKLEDATALIIQGRLGEHVGIKTGDEIEALAYAFNHMSDVIKEMRQEAQDSNPLTGLPGNNGIFEELQKRIRERQKFVLFHTDLDRFKVFNDHYGLSKGDEAIVRSAKLIQKAVVEKGSPDDFVGHQGGDDFVIITRPGRAEELGKHICTQFGKEVVQALYSKDDYERGFIEMLDRRKLAETGEKEYRKFPLLSISLAGVTNSKKDFANAQDCLAQTVPVKKKVKDVVESSYLIVE